MDLSNLDKKYFIDSYIYNCPFCNRNNVKYVIIDGFSFNWSEKKKCYGYLVRCSSCENTSLHLSFEDITISNSWTFKKIDIDDKIFYSQPTSFFVLDNNIPEKVRGLISEAENSRKSNLLTGASACLRKAIYELLKCEKVIILNEKTGYANYMDSIKSLKVKFAYVDEALFEALGKIQELSSDNVHEDSWEAWDSPKLKFLIELVKTTLHEIYVVPAKRKENLSILNKLKAEFSKPKPIESSDQNSAKTS